ncbi:Gingipain R1 precursor [bacterium BMS3Abin03]|nr:Gingipain R1 precursor [bacterium BMS3Abin03]
MYDSPDGLTFVILVGESNQIPTLYGQYEGAASDPCYTKLAGSDAYPDAFISRISPSSSDNLDYVLTKLIKYEKYPDTGPEAVWYLKGTGVASDQGDPPDYERAEWLRDMLMQDMHFTLVDQIYDPGAGSSEVTNALNDGRSILNYIGHGSGTSWGTTGFNVSKIHQLSNGYKNPFIIDVACVNGDFELGECMEEAWVRAGDTLNPKGAIAAFGASTNASWVPPCDMQNYAIFLLANRQIQTVGGACFNGIIHAMDLWGGSTGEGLKLMEQYNIMGDCTTLLAFGMVPDSTAPDQITDLSASDPTSSSVTLNWTSPFDSSFGGVVSYDLRYSTTPIINNNDFENAPSVIISGEPDTAGINKSYNLADLEFSTQYYFAIKAMDIWGNASEMSNVPYETTWAAPEIFVTPDSLYCMLLPDIVYTDSIMLSNITSFNSTLDYSIEFTNNTFPGQYFAKLVPVVNNVQSSFTKENPDNSKGSSIRGFGGPDTFGYKWIDSNEPDGPEYVWNDISGTGTLVTNWVATASYPPKDEGKAGPFPLGFTFKYYGIDYSEIWFISNGYLSFFDLNDAYWTNASMPSSELPNGIISPLWDDLDGSSGGDVYYKQEADKFIVQYINWSGFTSGTGPFTFQVVLYKNGKIMYYYNTISGSSNSCTVGIENENGTDGLQVVNNGVYLENDLAVQFSADPDWLTTNNYGGTIYNGNSVAVVLSFLTDGLELGDYSMDMVITSNDPDNPEIVIPISMTVTNEVPVELSSFTAENKVDKVILKWKTATETNNAGFEVERQNTSDEKGSTGWSRIAFVDGRGTTTEVSDYTFEDKIEKPGTYKYRLKQIDFNGTFEYSEEIEIEITGPAEYELYQNYPNPFNPTTTIKFALPVKSKVVISLYNSIGEKVAEPFSGELDEGYHEVLFDAANLPSGVYFYRLVSDKFVSVKKMILIK